MENQNMPKQYIEFKCQHQRIERTDDFFVVGGSQRYLYAKFDLCSDWSGLQQYAVFTGGLKTFRIPIVDGECEVPWEMLLEKRFFVGCEAGQRITSNAAEVEVHPCGVPEETGTTRKPTPTLQSQIGSLDKLKTEAKNNLVNAINELYDKPGSSTPGEPGKDGGYYIPNVSQVDEHTMRVYFTASKEGMADVADKEITLPSGKPGSDGTTPHIGENGNWFIGDTDTGNPSRGEGVECCPRVELTDSVVTLEPNRFYVFPEMASLSVTLGGEVDSETVQEYRFRFLSGAVPTTLILPEAVQGNMTVGANCVVEVSIIDNYAVSQSWAVN